MKINCFIRIAAPCIAATFAISLASTARAQEKVTFQDHILPIFRNACNSCHDPEKKKAGLDLTTYSAAMAGSDNGAMLIAGDAGGSMIFKVVTHAEEPTMPPKRDKLPQKDLDLIKQWIAGGLLDTKDGKPAAMKKPAVDLSVVANVGKPAGPSPIPTGLSAEPIVRTSRAGAVESLAASPWAPVMAVGGQKQIILYHSQTLEILGVLPFDEGVPNVLKFSPNGSILLAGGGVGAKLGKVVLFDVATGNRLTDVGDELDEVLAADISGDQKLVVLGGPNRLVKAYAVADGSEQYVIKKHTDWVTAVAISPNGEYLATGDRAGNLYVWEAKIGGELYSFTTHKEAITSLVFRDDSNVLMSGSGDATIKLWDMSEGKELKSVNAHPGGVTSARFAHDGRIVSTGRDGKVKTFDPTGAAAKDLTPAFTDIALHATFDDEGKRVFAGDWHGTVRVWDLADGKPVGEVSPNPPGIAERMTEASKKLADLQPAISKAEADVKTAEAAAAKAADEHSQLLTSIEKLKAEVEAGKKSLAEAQQQMDQRVGKAEKSVQEIVSSRNQVEEKTRQLAAAEQAVRDSEQAARNAAGDIKTLEAAVAAAQTQVEERQAEIRNAEAALKKNAKDDGAKAALAQAKQSIERRTTRLNDAKKALAAAQAKAKNAKPDPAAIKKAELAKAELAKAKQELAKLEKDGKANAEADKLASDRNKAAEALEKARSAVASAEKQIQPKADAVKAANDKVEPAKKALVDARAGLQGAQFGVAKLKAQQGATALHEAKKTLVAREAARASAEQAAKDATDLINKIKADIGAFEKARRESPAKIDRLTKQIPDLRKNVADVTAPFEAAGAELASREALALEAADLARRIGSAAEASKENGHLLEAEKSGKLMVEKLAAEINAAKQKVERWTAAKSKAEEALATASKELAQEKSDTANADRIRADLKKALANADMDLPKKQAAAKDAVKPIEEAKAKVEQAKAEYEKLVAEAAKVAPASTEQAKAEQAKND